MQSKQPKPPDKVYYKLSNNIWQRCFAIEAELLVCVASPIKPTYNEFMYAIDLRSQQKITDLNKIASEIQIDIGFNRLLPAMRTCEQDFTIWTRNDIDRS